MIPIFIICFEEVQILTVNIEVVKVIDFSLIEPVFISSIKIGKKGNIILNMMDRKKNCHRFDLVGVFIVTVASMIFYFFQN